MLESTSLTLQCGGGSGSALFGWACGVLCALWPRQAKLIFLLRENTCVSKANLITRHLCYLKRIDHWPVLTLRIWSSRENPSQLFLVFVLFCFHASQFSKLILCLPNSEDTGKILQEIFTPHSKAQQAHCWPWMSHQNKERSYIENVNFVLGVSFQKVMGKRQNQVTIYFT